MQARVEEGSVGSIHSLYHKASRYIQSKDIGWPLVSPELRRDEGEGSEVRCASS